MGMNLFISQKLARDMSCLETAKGVMPVLAADFIRIAFLVGFPALSLGQFLDRLLDPARQGPAGAWAPRRAPASAVVSRCQPICTWMRRGCTWAALGMRTRSTPWLSSALTCSASSSLLSVNARR